LIRFPDLKYEPQKINPQIKTKVGKSMRATNFGNVKRFSPVRHFLFSKSYSLQIPVWISHINSGPFGLKKNAKKIKNNIIPNRKRKALNIITP